MKRPINVQALDARFGHALSVVALAGGVAAQPQLAEWLGCPNRKRSLVRYVLEYGVGRRLDVPGTNTGFVQLTTAAGRELLCSKRFRAPASRSACTASVVALEYRLREGHIPLPVAVAAPDALQTVVTALQGRLHAEASRLKERIRPLRAAARTDREAAAQLRRLAAKHDAICARWPDSETAAAHFRETLTVRGVKLDPAMCDAGQLVFTVLPSERRRYVRLLAELSRAVPMEAHAHLRVLCGSAYEQSVAETHLRKVDEANPDQPMARRFINDAVSWEVLDLGYDRYFRGGTAPADFLGPAEAERAELLATIAGGRKRRR